MDELPDSLLENYIQAKPSPISKNLKRRDVLFFICALSILILFLYLSKFSQPENHWDRANDRELDRFVVVSPAAKRLPKKGKLFCWVQTSPKYHNTRAVAVNETWLNKCDHGQFFTSNMFKEKNIAYSTPFAGIPDSYDNLFYKSRYAFHYIWHNISKEFDWYYKADDDTYVIVEHLKEYLSTLDPNQPLYLGYTLRPYLAHGYNAGGAGYVLSRAALKLFAETLYWNETLCPDNPFEDVGIGRCFANLGIYPQDTRTAEGQNRFNTYRPDEVFHRTQASKEWTYFYPAEQVHTLLALVLLPLASSFLFGGGGGGGGGGCCCGCSTPQPASCGCRVQCPAPTPCAVCPSPPPCPPPPTAVCPQVQPIYLPSCSGSSCGGGGSYATYPQSSGGYAQGGGGGYSLPIGGGGGGGGYSTAGQFGGFSPASSGGQYDGGDYSSNSAGGYFGPVHVAPSQANSGDSYQERAAAATNQESVVAIPAGPEQPEIKRSPKHEQLCEPGQVKYVVLKSKRSESPSELDLQYEEISPVEATAKPLDIDSVSDIEDMSQADITTITDAKCNSKELKDLIDQGIVPDDPLSTKQNIHDLAVKIIPEYNVDIVCSSTGFTYLVSTTEHCESQKNGVICFIYKRPL